MTWACLAIFYHGMQHIQQVSLQTLFFVNYTVTSQKSQNMLHVYTFSQILLSLLVKSSRVLGW